MRTAVALLLVSLLAGCGNGAKTPQERLANAHQALNEAQTDEQRFYALGDAAKESFVLGRTDDARRYAEELLLLLPRFTDNWNYGNAVQDVHVTLGRIAVAEGRIDDAKRHLLEAGRSPGSPQMDSFGPSMILAKDLLEKGERDTVLAYFELCRRFWDAEGGRLDQWSSEVRAGTIPDFGGNLIY